MSNEQWTRQSDSSSILRQFFDFLFLLARLTVIATTEELISASFEDYKDGTFS